MSEGQNIKTRTSLSKKNFQKDASGITGTVSANQNRALSLREFARNIHSRATTFIFTEIPILYRTGEKLCF